MRLALSQKIILTLTVALLLATVGIGLALVSARQAEERQEDLAATNLEQARVIYELEIAVLEQGELAAHYLLDGDARWLAQLHQREPDFEQSLERVRRAGLEQNQQGYVGRIGEAYRAYATERDNAIATYQRGDQGAARAMLARQVHPAYDHAFRLCEELSAANKLDIEAANAAQGEQARSAQMWSTALLVLAAAFAAGVIWLVLVRVLRPIRRMARELVAASDAGAGGAPQDELQAIRAGVEQLRSSVAEARSRLERSNQHLFDAQQLASVGRLAAGVAHEIRSPLTALRLRLFSIQKALAGAPERRADLQVMSEEISRLEGMVSSFLEFSRPPTLNLQRCSIALLLDKTLDLLRYRLEAGRVQIEREEPADAPSLMADPQQLKQVFLNLLSNAIDALPAGGVIGISVAEAARGPAGPGVVIRVRDNGVGIPAEAVPRIFDPFFSTKEKGAGLGLWVAYRIVAEHQGALTLERSVPGATVFAVRLPVVAPVLAGGSCDEHDTGR